MRFLSYILLLSSLLFAKAPVITSTMTMQELNKLTASDGAEGDFFGYSVAISGDLAIVGAYGDDDNGNETGSAYIFQDDGNGNFTLTNKLIADDADVDNYFGISVAISGDLAIVGAYLADGRGGGAYIFQDDGNGNFTQTNKLMPNDGATDDYFGSSVAISGDLAIVGATGDDEDIPSSGSAYIFQDDGNGNFIETDRLDAYDKNVEDNFGVSVAISGDLAIVGATGDDDNGNESGSAYIFQDDGNGNFTHTNKLTANDGAAADNFGSSVAISGDLAIVGAHQDDDNGNESGSAYIFQNNGNGNFTQTNKLTASDGAADDYFSYSVAISGDLAIVGAFFDDDNGNRSGSAYIFKNAITENSIETQPLCTKST